MMKKALLCPLALLLQLACHPGPGHALERLPSSGEWCRAWKYTAVGTGLLQSPMRSFRCPERYDRSNATFCCGSCRLPYCCASRAAHLDLDRCAVAGKAATAVPRWREQILLDFVWLCFGMVAFSVLCCVAHTVYYHLGDCQKTSKEEPQLIPMENLHARTQVNHDLNGNDPFFPNNATFHHYSMSWNLNPPQILGNIAKSEILMNKATFLISHRSSS